MIPWLLRLFARFRELEAIEESQHLLQATVSRLQNENFRLSVDLSNTTNAHASLNSQATCLVEAKNQLSEKISQLELDATSLRSSLSDAQSENARLQDRLEAALEEKNRVWDLYEKAVDGERQALRMGVNEHWKTRYGTVPYPEAPSPSDKSVRDPDAPREALGRSFDLPSQRAAKQAAQNVQAWVDEMAGKG